MNEASFGESPIERRSALGKGEFLERYLAMATPVVVSDEATRWPAYERWSFDFLREHFGDEDVSVYGDLFSLQSIVKLREFFNQLNDATSQTQHGLPYARWYTRSRAADGPWADRVFERLRADWTMPGFLPTTGYALPLVPTTHEVDATVDSFPGRGLFISPSGARTRLHCDPWASDAVLCQLHGVKRVVLFHPRHAANLMREAEVVDIERPDARRFPRANRARADFVDYLRPGEVLYIPRGWYHHVGTMGDAISLTWNFVHQSAGAALKAHLASDLSLEERKVIEYFSACAHGRPVSGGPS